MKLHVRYCVLLVFFLFFSIIAAAPTAQKVYAVNDCAVAQTFPDASNPSTLDAKVCIGGFTSKTEASKPLEITAICTGKSGWDNSSTTPCYQLARQTKTVSAGENNVLPDNAGRYYTCFDVQQINRDVGEILVTFKNTAGTQICATDTFSTVPANYNWWERVTRSVTSNLGGTQYNTGNSSQAIIFCNGNSGVWTAIGCISTDPAGFITKFLGFGVGIAGGIAFLLILFGGFQILTSAGNPEQMNAGKELISSAIAGLLLIIFSILLLKIIGFNILGIPDFG